MAFSDEKLQSVRDYLDTCPNGTAVYIGCDSNRRRNGQGIWIASYTSVVVIHVVDEFGIGHGCRVFTETDEQEDYDQKKNRPFMRMMNEAYRAVEVYEQLEEDLLEHEVEVHLDINKDEKHGSHCAYSAAVGYVRGVTGRPVMTKPDAWAATHVADHGVRGKFRPAQAH